MFTKTLLSIKPTVLYKRSFSVSSRAQDTNFWKQSDKDIFKSVDKAQKKIRDADAMKKVFQTDYRKRIVQDILDVQGSDVDIDKVLEEISKDKSQEEIPDIKGDLAMIAFFVVMFGICM